MKQNIKFIFFSTVFLLTILSVTIFWVVSKFNLNTDNSFIFAVEADPHMDGNSDENIFRQSLNQINLSKASFLMDLGDTFMTDKLTNKTEANILQRYTLMRGYFNNLNMPLYLVKGNHDGENGWDTQSLQTYSSTFRQQYFPSSFSKTYYSFVTSDTLFIILDPYLNSTTKPDNDGWMWTLGKEQYDWLKTTLENSTAKHKMVFIHHLVGGDSQGRGGIEYVKFYEWGGYNKNGTYGFDTNRSGWGKPIHQLLVDNGVEIVFKGHDHIYAKQELDGIIYQTVPQPSHPGDNSNNATSYGYVNGDIYGTSGFLKVITTVSSTTVQYIKYDGTIIDSYNVD